jgi:glycosyltransferase involved in cell wall biosynthesis
MEQELPVIDIVMTTWNRPIFTELAVKSIFQNTTYPHRLIVIDNGSDKQTADKLIEMRKEKMIDTLILLDKNYGLEWAKNKAMEFVESYYFVSTDNDILAYKYEIDWLTQLTYLMDDYPEYGAIACRPQILVGTGNIFEGKTKDIVDFTHVPGYLRIMRTDLVRQLGAWNDKRPLRGHEEYWISEKMSAEGYKVGWARNVECWHLFGDENDWGYTGMQPEEHGHNPVSGLPHDDWTIIKEKVGI